MSELFLKLNISVPTLIGYQIYCERFVSFLTASHHTGDLKVSKMIVDLRIES